MQMKKIGELERSNLAANVADVLRESILTGDLPPGAHLYEAELAQQMGVSRGPVREALRILETEGLLENHPGRGSFVAQISERDIREVYSLRTILEQEAIKLAAEKASPEDIHRLSETVQAMFSAAEEANHDLVTQLDFQFHHQIWDIADHQLLKQVLEGITTQVRIFLAVTTHLYNNLSEGISEHRVLLSALEQGDGEKCAQVMRKHIQDSSEVVLKYFREKTEPE